MFIIKEPPPRLLEEHIDLDSGSGFFGHIQREDPTIEDRHAKKAEIHSLSLSSFMGSIESMNRLKATILKFNMLWKILLIPSFFLLFTSLVGFYTSIKPSKIVSDITPKNFGLAYEEVSLRTNDDVTLTGWWLPNKNPSAKTILLLHGYPADKSNILPAIS